MFSQVFQLQPDNNGTDLTWAVLVALLTIGVNIVALVAQWRKDVKRAQLESEQSHNVADKDLIDQYQEELKQCREDRIGFRKERSEWERERAELIGRIGKLESEKRDMTEQIYQLSMTNKRHEAEIVDLRTRLQAALET